VFERAFASVNTLKNNVFCLIFPVAKKGTIKCGGNQDEKTRESGENFYNYLFYIT